MKIKTLALVAVCAVAIPFAAVAGPAKPGKWETTVETTVGDRVMPAHTVTHCLTKEEAEMPDKIIPQPTRSDCAMTDVKVDGGTVTWKMKCEKTQMHGEGTMTYAADSYTGKMVMTSPAYEVHVKYSGKYVGACDAK